MQGQRLSEQEYAEIRDGNHLLISCQGDHECGGWLCIPFSPVIGDAAPAEPLRPGGVIWTRVSGETIEDITLSPSINAYECGHFHIQNGAVV